MTRIKRSLILVVSILSLFVWSTAIFSQTRKSSESLPKLSVRARTTGRARGWLKKRLDTMLLPMMRQQKIEMWIVTNEEFHADPVTAYIAPPLPYVRAGAISLSLPIVVETNSIASRWFVIRKNT